MPDCLKFHRFSCGPRFCRPWRLLGLAVFVLLAGAAAHAKTIEEHYDSGVLKSRYTVGTDDQRNGPFQVFSEDGKIKQSGEYRGGGLEGFLSDFYPDGKPARRISYHNGVLDGPSNTFDDKGRRTTSAEYRAGKRHGVFREYTNDAVVTEQLYIDDELIYPRSPAMIAAQLAEISKAAITTVSGGADIPAHRGGNTSQPDREAAVRLLMQYRYLCNVPYQPLQLDARYNAHDEAATAILAAIGKLNHKPPNPGWPKADYQFAFEGTSHSNLQQGSGSSVDAVHGFMDDSDPSNIDRIGHRRWCLNPAMGKVGFAGAQNFAAMWVFDNSRHDVPDYEFIAYPAPGLFPNTFFHAGYAWHLTPNPRKYRKPDPKSVHVEVKPAQVTRSPLGLHTSAAIKLNYFHVDNQNFGIGDVIIFRPEGCSTASGAAYQVEISGLTTSKGEKAPPLHYLVEFYTPGK